MPEPPEPTRRADTIWLEPYPDALLDGVADASPGPEVRYEMREAVGLAFVAALQHLPPRQRAVLVLRDVLGFDGAEVADMLGSSEASIKGARQRARATLDTNTRVPAGGRERAPVPSSARERELVGRFVDAVERGDIDGVVSMLTADAWLTMPPQPYEHQGRVAIAGFLRDRAHVRGVPLRLLTTRANGQPAFGCYLPDPAIARAYGLLVLTLQGDRVSAITWFVDRGVFPHFGLPGTLHE
jgi:RNA polymerase sigma-70 factor (TIGR02960 family)